MENARFLWGNLSREEQMKIRKWKRGAAAAAALILAIQSPISEINPLKTIFAYTEKSASVDASSLNVRSGPGTSNSIVAKLSKGAAVTVIGEASAPDGALWYQIRFTSGGQEMTGYVSKSYVKFRTAYTSDADFEAFLNAEGFPESYKDGLRALHAEYPQWIFRAHKTGLDWSEVIENESVVGRNLVAASSISSWKSTADGAYNWSSGTWPGFDGSAWVAASSDIISYYMDPRNFLDEYYIFQFLLQTYDGSLQTIDGVHTMLEGTFMEGGGSSDGSSAAGQNPDGSSDGTGSGQTSGTGPGGSGSESQEETSEAPSEESSTEASAETSAPANGDAPSGSGNPGISFEGPVAAVSKHRTGLLMEGPGDYITSDGPGAGSSSPSSGSGTAGRTQTASGISYAEAIMNAGAQSGVNPYVLAAMIIQEVGTGGSRSVSGTDSNYPGYYNFYNIGAYTTDTMDAITRGLWYASQSGSYGRPWNTPEKAIIGGAEFYGTNYVKAGQDTFYLKKFNVQGADIYKHQYMGNVVAAASEGYHMAEAYNDDLKNSALEFKIPVYNNMPASPCAKPVVDGSPNNKLSGLGVEGFNLTPTFNMDTTSYDLIVDQSVSNVNVWASAIDSKAVVSGTGSFDLQSGINEIRINVKAENGTVREYVLNVVRQVNGPTYSQGAGENTSSPAGGGSSSSGTGEVSAVGPGADLGPVGTAQ